jgi:DNA-binding HxlR family transcriptional regulator
MDKFNVREEKGAQQVTNRSEHVNIVCNAVLYLIKHDVNRFGMLQKHMPRISKKVLTALKRIRER